MNGVVYRIQKSPKLRKMMVEVDWSRLIREVLGTSGLKGSSRSGWRMNTAENRATGKR
jgi:hypothetical protein